MYFSNPFGIIVILRQTSVFAVLNDCKKILKKLLQCIVKWSFKLRNIRGNIFITVFMWRASVFTSHMIKIPYFIISISKKTNAYLQSLQNFS